MNQQFAAPLIILIAVAVIGLAQSIYIVDEREQAILLQLGQPVGDVKKPGLHFKLPIVQNVRRFDQRVLSVDPAPREMVINSSSLGARKTVNEEGEEVEQVIVESAGGEPIIVDTFARYRIIDPLAFMKTLRSVPQANLRIENILEAATRSVLGNTTLRDLLSSKRAGIMDNILERMAATADRDNLGIEIVDARIIRADLSQNLLEATVRRMNSELQERAAETRARGEERAIEIRSTADKERTVILAEAERDAQIIKGAGDREAIETYAKAFNKDKDFYAFLRSMEAYKNTFTDDGSAMILSPDSAFLKYLQSKKP